MANDELCRIELSKLIKLRGEGKLVYLPLFSCCEKCEDGKSGSFSDKRLYNMNFGSNCGRKLGEKPETEE
ncbi:MAG TPA: hypothetical protein PKI60_07280 [Oscillospiraceae bacterium]|nr:hypothetical protein [Oscillospiraceae bacterium]